MEWQQDISNSVRLICVLRLFLGSKMGMILDMVTDRYSI